MFCDNLYSDNALNMRPSPVRQLLSRADKDKLISFAGGYPDPVTFPIHEIKQIMAKVLDEQGATALQYGASEGVLKLREIIAARYVAQGLDVTYKNIVITTSSQQGIDLTTKLFVNPDDVVLCSLPSYLGALQSFYSYRADIVGVRDGDSYSEAVERLLAQGKCVKFIYSIPDFQNPSGITIGLEQRKELIEVAQKYNLMIIEDSPYRDIRYEGCHLPTLYSMDSRRVLQLGTFSKTFAPGFRIGWIVGPEPVVEKIAVSKQSADLCAPVFDQYVVAEYIESGLFDSNLQKTIALYRQKRDFAIECLEKYMPAGVSWTKPQGGLFLFVTFPPDFDAMKMYDVALKANVAYVAGELFHCDGSGKNTMRINFSQIKMPLIEQGLKVLATICQSFHSPPSAIPNSKFQIVSLI